MIALGVVCMFVMVFCSALPSPTSAETPAAEPLRITHGIASGDVSDRGRDQARESRRPDGVVYARTRDERPPLPVGPLVEARDDFTGKGGPWAHADTRYIYWVRFSASAEGVAIVSEAGQFRTAPDDGTARALSLVWWGDVGGQDYCRDPERGYAIFTQMARLTPDVAIANGDAVYTDYACPPVTTLPDHPRNLLSPDPETAAYQLLFATDPRFTTVEEVVTAFRAKWR
jgi:phosphodiesterase/alkaline phosphatase D-like protein